MRIALATLLLAACAGSQPPPGGADSSPGEPDAAANLPGDLLLGGAEASGVGFVELGDGADVSLIWGAQGGYHVWTAVRARGLSGELRVERNARLVADDSLV